MILIHPPDRSKVDTRAIGLYGVNNADYPPQGRSQRGVGDLSLYSQNCHFLPVTPCQVLPRSAGHPAPKCHPAPFDAEFRSSAMARSLPLGQSTAHPPVRVPDELAPHETWCVTLCLSRTAPRPETSRNREGCFSPFVRFGGSAADPSPAHNHGHLRGKTGRRRCTISTPRKR